MTPPRCYAAALTPMSVAHTSSDELTRCFASRACSSRWASMMSRVRRSRCFSDAGTPVSRALTIHDIAEAAETGLGMEEQS